MNTEAKIIAHSSASNGAELITFQTRSPKFLDAEFEKHRMISSNSSSDRAIPFSRMKDQEFFVPNDVRLNEKGMQGYEKVCESELMFFKHAVAKLRNEVLTYLEPFSDIHKQHLNRYLLPWSWQNKISTANREWFEYFIGLRAAEGADPAIQELARKMQDALDNSEATLIHHYEWHLPYIKNEEKSNLTMSELRRVSAARCARVSYSNHDGSEFSLGKDQELCDILEKSQHWTPFEHQATAFSTEALENYSVTVLDQRGITHTMSKSDKICSGNFHSFIQYRQLLQD